jgi:hypothetical protein
MTRSAGESLSDTQPVFVSMHIQMLVRPFQTRTWISNRPRFQQAWKGRPHSYTDHQALTGTSKMCPVSISEALEPEPDLLSMQYQCRLNQAKPGSRRCSDERGDWRSVQIDSSQSSLLRPCQTRGFSALLDYCSLSRSCSFPATDSVTCWSIKRLQEVSGPPRAATTNCVCQFII